MTDPSIALTKPSKLADVQRLMMRAVSQPLTRDDEMQTNWRDGGATAEVAESFIKPNDRLTSFDRLQIYNQQYWWRLLSNFGDDFSGVRAVLGQRKFDRLAVAYIESHGSQNWTMRDLGCGLETFLLAHPDLTAPHEALALDVARVEWARVIAFDGPEKPALDPQRIAATGADQLRLELQPFITLLDLSHPVDELLLKLKKTGIETGVFSNAMSGGTKTRAVRLRARPVRKPIYLAVHRHRLAVYYKRLDREAFRLLRALRDGATLADACAEAFAASTTLPEQNAARIQQWFSDWMSFGWFVE